jgi:nucleoside-diphosphate-sugar epimerase
VAERTILVAGALGVIGRTLIEHCRTGSACGDAAVIGLGRRPPPPDSDPGEYRSVDLADPGSCERGFSDLDAVTHLVYAAWQPRPTRREEVAPNLAMLRNLMEVLERAAPRLRHVTLLQGAKAYGSHLGPFRTPARETDPRHMPPNFYYDQQDWLAARRRCRDWAWTIFRPTFVYGFGTGNPMNLTTVIAVYAAISRELGVPLRFPGSEAAYRVLGQAVDAGLIARAILWAGESEAARDEVFNITNGDLFRWAQIWPHIAGLLGMPCAEPQRIPLVEFMQDKGPVWDAVTRRYGLQPHAFEEIASWPFGESSLNREYDHILDTTKLRDAGFLEHEDSYRMFARHIRMLQERRIIPPAPAAV